MDSKVFSPVMRCPPMTSGYSRPISAFTFSKAFSIAALLSGLLKSVSGSFLNSVCSMVVSFQGWSPASMLQPEAWGKGRYVIDFELESKDADGTVRGGAVGRVMRL